MQSIELVAEEYPAVTFYHSKEEIPGLGNEGILFRCFDRFYPEHIFSLPIGVKASYEEIKKVVQIDFLFRHLK